MLEAPLEVFLVSGARDNRAVRRSPTLETAARRQEDIGRASEQALRCLVEKEQGREGAYNDLTWDSRALVRSSSPS